MHALIGEKKISVIVALCNETILDFKPLLYKFQEYLIEYLI